MVVKVNFSELLFEMLIICGMVFFSYVNSTIGQMLLIGFFCVRITNRILKGNYTLYELLILIVAGLFVGSNYLLYFGIVFNAIYLAIARKKAYLEMDAEIIGFAIMLVAGSISSFLYATDTKSANQYIFIYFLLFLFLWENKIIFQKMVVEEKSGVRFFSAFSLMLGIGFFMTHTFKELQSLFRMEIFYNLKQGVGSNTLAGIMAPFFLGCILIVIESGDRKSRILSLLAVVMLAPVLLVIQSRGVYLGIFAAIVWLLFAERSPKVIGVLLSGLTLAALFLVLNPYIFERFFGRFSNVVRRTGSPLNGREKLYMIAWDMFKTHPLTGNGFWQFGVNGIMEKDPHNFILAYLASTGIIGMAGFLLYMTAVYRRLKAALKMQENSSKLLGEIKMVSYIVFLVHGCVEPSLSTQAPLSIFILLTMLPVRMEIYNSKEESPELTKWVMRGLRGSNKDVTAK